MFTRYLKFYNDPTSRWFEAKTKNFKRSNFGQNGLDIKFEVPTEPAPIKTVETSKGWKLVLQMPVAFKETDRSTYKLSGIVDFGMSLKIEQ